MTAKRPSPRHLVLAALVVAVVAVLGAAFAGLGDARPGLPTLPAAAAKPAEGHLPFGRIEPPRALPEVALTLDDGTETNLAAETADGWTLLQTMFAGCATTCPIQGVLFQRAAAALDGVPVRLLSVSIDPIGDNPRVLAGWLRQFEAPASWRAARPALADLGPLLDALGARDDGADIHAARAYLIDPAGRLIFITEELPDPDGLAGLVREAIAALSPDFAAPAS
ncbi:SCO family protein [Methylobrevis albus]|uniref:SCO family protein n=1 Tax=Methylobrevis albus TaxID=2793297 RepID=A0A931N0S8_9HYPH|nr:SCO family protein [Methylobrevis albus]MBH0239544.1 SCO family protein [Methylobrevis albus]